MVATIAAPFASSPTAAAIRVRCRRAKWSSRSAASSHNGYSEIVLSGVDITSWGTDLPGRPRLGNLVRRILKAVPELKRLRLSSIDSIEADEDLMRAIAEEERLMPHLHLSLQAGDDMILKRMKRRHLRDHSIAFCAEIRRLRPDIVFGADIIAGFPTETDQMFENSLRHRRGMRPYFSACLSVLAASGHACGAHAATAQAHDPGSGPRLARQGQGAARCFPDGRGGRVALHSGRDRDPWAARNISPR